MIRRSPLPAARLMVGTAPWAEAADAASASASATNRVQRTQPLTDHERSICGQTDGNRSGTEPPEVAGRIGSMRKDRPAVQSDITQPPALPKDESRVEMMRRVKRLSLEQRIELFERLSRDAAWARSAKRVR